MQFKESFPNPNPQEVFVKLHEWNDLLRTCHSLFSWLAARSERDDSFKATLDSSGEAICVDTPAGTLCSRILMAEDETGVFARIVFVGRLDPEDERRDVPVYALTIRNYDAVVGGDEPGRKWDLNSNQHGPWAHSDAMALGYALLDGLLKAGSKLLLAAPAAG